MKHTKKLNRQLILSLGIIFLFIFSSLASALPIKILGSGTPGIGQERLFTLTIHIEGNGEVYPPSGSQFKPGKSTPVFALSSDNWVFRRWEGDLTGSENPSSLHMDSDKTITAVFDQYVSIENGKFMYQDEPFYPITMNYGIDICKDSNGYYIGPYHAFFPDNRACDDKEDGLFRINKHLKHISSLGFNSIRLVGLAVRPNETNTALVNRYLDMPDQNPIDFVYDENSIQTIVAPMLSEFLSIADTYNLKVLLLTGHRGVEHKNLSQNYTNIIGLIAEAFSEHTTLIGYDLYNEPSWNDAGDNTKQNISANVSQWSTILREKAPHHLITMGHTDSGVVFEWDPSLMDLDFHSYHLYPFPSEYTSEGVQTGFKKFLRQLRWVSEVMNEPWIIGETGFSAHPDPEVYFDWGTPQDQKDFAHFSLRSVRDAGGVGYSWWSYSDGNAAPAENKRLDFMGVIASSDPRTDEWPKPHLKPVSFEFNDFDPFAQGNYDPINDDFYYNPYNYSKYKISGRVIKPNDITIPHQEDDALKDSSILYKSVSNAVIYANSRDWKHFTTTFSKPDGTFELHSDKPIRIIKLSALGLEIFFTNKIQTMFVGRIAELPGIQPLAHNSLVNCYTHGVFGVTQQGQMIRAYWTYPQGWMIKQVESTAGLLEPGSFLYTGDGINPGQLYGINTQGHIVTVIYDTINQTYEIVELPGQQSMPALSPHSLIYTNDKGLYAVTTTGVVVHAIQINDTWKYSLLVSNTGSIKTDSLLATDQHHISPFYAINEQGKLVGIIPPKLLIQQIPGQEDITISDNSLVYNQEHGVFGVTENADIIHINYNGKTWINTILNSNSGVNNIVADSLITTKEDDTSVVFGVNDHNKMIHVNISDTSEYGVWLVKHQGSLDIVPYSLSYGYDNGVFCITTDGKLHHGREGGFITITSWAGKILPGSLISEYNNEGGRVYGVNQEGKMVGTWINPDVDIGDIVLQPVDFS
jgi:hypothetical protein